jgi:hypothetical protein
MQRLAFVILSMISIWLFFFGIQDRFCIDNISPHHADHLTWPSRIEPVLSDDLATIFDQPYTYLGKGRQSYAFVSNDGSYVLKFIKFTYLKPSFFNNTNHAAGQLKRLHRVLLGYQLAFEKDRENTGLIYVHFQKTHHLGKKLQVTDRFKLKHRIDLDEVFFVVQKKGVMTRDRMKALLQNHKMDQAKEQIGKILELYVSEYRKGLYDSDHNVMSNTGFVGDRAVRLDAGRLKEDDSFKKVEIFKQDLEKITHQRFKKWILKNFPQYFDELMQAIEIKTQEIIG